VLVNVLAPGIVDAGLSRRPPGENGRDRRLDVIPLDRLQHAGEVATAAATLCGSDLDYMTGAVLLVDGGCSLLVTQEDDP
jgi:NAD(P)-dependent dehydrogenase (short-subunit alcohol dehydrogenase family)